MTCRVRSSLQFSSDFPTVTRSSALPHRLLAIVLILLMQGPAMLVQEVAWVKMLVSYTQERGLARGVVETFDGKHPCELCAKASEIRKDEGNDEPSERQSGAMRFRLSWAEMVPSAMLFLPGVPELEIVRLGPQWIFRGRGRGAEAPASPPPERV